MKYFILFLGLLIAGCATKRPLPATDHPVTTASGSPADSNMAPAGDSLSNFVIFDAIDRLDKKQFTVILDSVKQRLPASLFWLRMAYTHTGQYDPYDPDVGKAHKKIRAYLKAADYPSALNLADSLLYLNYVDIPSHLYSGFAHLQLGDSLLAGYHYSLYYGLLESISESGDGKAPESAFIVISTKEIYNLLYHLKLETRKQALYNIGGHHFDLMTVKDSSGVEQNLYFNVSLPFRHMSALFD